ncbi:MAG: heme-copper oxidase subunit III [Chthoniobacterales bacterium]
MTTISHTSDEIPQRQKLPSKRKVGMLGLIIAESSLFTIFVVAYVFYLGKSLNPPYPSQVLELPLLASICLFSSSFTILLAERALKKNSRPVFFAGWGITILLGAAFITFTALEWRHLIFEKHLWISTNVFGTTFYSLVGLHASHVIIGLVLLTVTFISGLRGKIDASHHEHVEMVSWYWHFVDAIWLVVLTLVYIIGV